MLTRQKVVIFRTLLEGQGYNHYVLQYDQKNIQVKLKYGQSMTDHELDLLFNAGFRVDFIMQVEDGTHIFFKEFDIKK